MNEENKNLPAKNATSTEMVAPGELTAGQVWNSFQEMAKDPTIDPAKMQTLYEVQKQMITDMRQEEFNQAKFAAMAEMPTIIKNRIVKNKSGETMYRYSDFKNLYLAVKPILAAQGLVLDFDVDETNLETKVPFLRVAPILRHKNGYVWNGSYMPVPITAPNSTVTLTQASKGAVETGKRTTLISCLGITEDEDPTITGEEPKQISMSVDEEKLWTDGMSAATKGLADYEKWFKGLTNVQRGWLVDNQKHQQLKDCAIKAG